MYAFLFLPAPGSSSVPAPIRAICLFDAAEPASTIQRRTRLAFSPLTRKTALVGLLPCSCAPRDCNDAELRAAAVEKRIHLFTKRLWQLTEIGNAFRDLVCELLRTKFSDAQVEQRINGTKVDILFSRDDELGSRELVAVECKDYAKPLTKTMISTEI